MGIQCAIGSMQQMCNHQSFNSVTLTERQEFVLCGCQVRVMKSNLRPFIFRNNEGKVLVFCCFLIYSFVYPTCYNITFREIHKKKCWTVPFFCSICICYTTDTGELHLYQQHMMLKMASFPQSYPTIFISDKVVLINFPKVSHSFLQSNMSKSYSILKIWLKLFRKYMKKYSLQKILCSFLLPCSVLDEL